MQLITKRFAEELNKCLDDLGAPHGIRERAAILSKMLFIPKHQAWGMLEGLVPADEALLKKMETELELDIKPFLNTTQSK